MSDKIKDKNLHFDIATFERFICNNTILIDVLNHIMDRFVLPCNQPLLLHVEKMNSRNRMEQYSAANWEKLISQLRKGEVQYIHLITDDNYSDERNYLESAISLSVTCDYEQEYKHLGYTNRTTNSLAFSMGLRTLKEITQETQTRWCDLFKKVFTDLNSVTGYLTYGLAGARWAVTETMLEDVHRLSYYHHSQYFDKVARGYFWGNILSEGHIEQLGGIDHILKDVPCSIVEPLKFGDRSAVYLQLTPDINNYTDDQLREFRKFLRPVLPYENIELIKKNDPTGKWKEWGRLIYDEP